MCYAEVTDLLCQGVPSFELSLDRDFISRLCPLITVSIQIYMYTHHHSRESFNATGVVKKQGKPMQ